MTSPEGAGDWALTAVEAASQPAKAANRVREDFSMD